jgi:hypothetical protein
VGCGGHQSIEGARLDRKPGLWSNLWGRAWKGSHHLGGVTPLAVNSSELAALDPLLPLWVGGGSMSIVRWMRA